MREVRATRLAWASALLLTAAACMPQAAAAPHFAIDPILVGPPGSAPLASVAILSGCWRGPDRDGTGVYEERWSAPAGGLMVGSARGWRGATLRSWEHLAIRSRDGEVVYLPSPGGEPSPAVFRLQPSPRRGELLFTAPEHDYPRRILYRIDGDRLELRADGGEGDGSPLRWSLVRVGCDG